MEPLPGFPAHLQPEVRLEGRLVELQLQVGVREEEVLHPVVGQSEGGQLAALGDVARELEPGAPVTRLGAGRLHQDVARVVVQVEALQHDAVQVEAIPVEELNEVYRCFFVANFI